MDARALEQIVDNGSPTKALNVQDAMTYLEHVRLAFSNNPEIYNKFLDIMKEFKGDQIHTSEVIERAITLFAGYTHLIQGFNTFLPPGYSIDLPGPSQSAPLDLNTIEFTVSTPYGPVKVDQGVRERGLANAILLLEKHARFERGVSAHAHSHHHHHHHHHRPSSAAPVTTQPQIPRPASVASMPQGHYEGPQQLRLLEETHRPHSAISQNTPAAATVLSQGFFPPNFSAHGLNQSGKKVEFNHAISYVGKIKSRFAQDPQTYQSFLNILQTYQKENKHIQEVYAEVTTLFASAPDLLDEFKEFLPAPEAITTGTASKKVTTTSTVQPTLPMTSTKRGSHSSSEAPPAKKKRPPALERSSKKRLGAQTVDIPADLEIAYSDIRGIGPSCWLHPPQEQLSYFERCKEYIGDDVVYHEFMSLINNFNQNFADLGTFVGRMGTFVGGNPSLWEEFKLLVGWRDGKMGERGQYVVRNDRIIIENVPVVEPPKLGRRNPDKYGPNYRLLRKEDADQLCSGRDALCKEVLNDRLACRGMMESDDFQVRSIRPPEEALFSAEEQRHEFDYWLDSIARAANNLENIFVNMRAHGSSNNGDYSNFRLQGYFTNPKFGMERILKKIYGKDRVPDILNAIEETPWTSIGIILSRLRQKEEEWKLAQSEWAGTWAETERENYWKALDVQGSNFMAVEKKRFSTTRFVQEIELKRRSQLAVINGTGELQRTMHQFKFELKDKEVFYDLLKLSIVLLDRLASPNKVEIEELLKTLISLTFGISLEEVTTRLTPLDDPHTEGGAEEGLTSGTSTPASNASKRAFKRTVNPDLRKRAIKNAGGSSRKRGSGRGGSVATSRSPSVSRSASPALEVDAHLNDDAVGSSASLAAAINDAMEVDNGDVTPSKEEPARSEDDALFIGQRRLNLFADTTYYCFFYAFLIIYDRLVQVKILNDEKAEVYPRFLESCEKRFEGEISASEFEDFLKELIGPQSYVMFQIERNINFLLKMLEHALLDPSCIAILDLLKQDRFRTDRTSTSWQLNYKKSVYQLLNGASELYRIEWIPGHQAITFYLYGKDEPGIGDPTEQEEIWKSYMADYALNYPTKGLEKRVTDEFLLRRNLKQGVPLRHTSRANMENRISMLNFKMKPVAGTEDSWVVFRDTKPTNEQDIKAAKAAKFVQWAEKEVEHIAHPVMQL